MPLTSPWAESTIGGIVATNFNGPLCIRYGAIRDLILTVTAVLPDGRVIRAGRPVVKNVAGYDLAKLFAGLHGTLGLITDVTFKILPFPLARTSLFIPVDDLSRGLTLGDAPFIADFASGLVYARTTTLSSTPLPIRERSNRIELR